MKSISRTAKAGSVALVVALGLSMPAADAAAPSTEARTAHAKGGHSQDDHGKGHHGKGDHGKADRGSKAEKKLERAARKLVREVARKDDHLARLLGRHKLTRLDDEVAALVTQNIAADRAELAPLLADDAAPTTLEEVRSLADALDELRPERYNTILNDLRKALRLRAELADAADTSGTVDAATVEALIAKLVTFDASTPRAELRAAKRELSQLWDSVSDETDDETGETDETGDEVEDEPADDDQAEDEAEESETQLTP